MRVPRAAGRLLADHKELARWVQELLQALYAPRALLTGVCPGSRYHSQWRHLNMAADDEVELAGLAKRAGMGQRVADAILDVVGAIPKSSEVGSDAPHARAAALAKSAAKSAATISGGAALVPGPFGMLTLLPDIIGVWQVQAQMVADIAATYGKTASLTKEQMLYCLFRHMFSQGLRDVVVRAGERYLVRRASLQLLQKLATMIGIKVTQRAMGKTIARYAPLVGAAGVAAYAFYDTKKVAATATELFCGEIVFEPERRDESGGAVETPPV